jgi:HAD superfamily hydrolase (TIGR01450 family)
MHLSEKRLFLLDMDGTLYLDDRLFDNVLPFLEHIKRLGARTFYLTNNSSKSVDKYVQKLTGLGIEATAEDFFTSASATLIYLKKHHSASKIYAFGTASFRAQLAEGGLNITDRLEDDIDCLVCGYDTELTFQKLDDACILLGRGVDFIATNPDWVCPTWYGYVPDCGSVCEMLRRATGRRARFIGKPQPEMALLAIERSGFSKEQAIMIGDRIYTDVKCGINAGISTALVLSGESTLQTLAESDVKPEYVFDDISALFGAMKEGQSNV